MTYMPVTSFRRPVDAVQLAASRAVDGPLPDAEVNKWQLLRQLAEARHQLGLSDRTLAVLQALLSFHPATDLADGSALIVYPSNTSLCQRLNAMPCSTMRRHLAALVAAGLVARRDSPNGKRYARGAGDTRDAFGFDLTPLVSRAPEIAALAETTRRDTEARERLRQRVSLMRRDLAGLVAFGLGESPLPLWDRLGALAMQTARALRRKLGQAELEALEHRLASALATARACLDATDPGTGDARNEQHNQKSETDYPDSERPEKDGRHGATCHAALAQDRWERMETIEPSGPCDEKMDASLEPPLPLRLVLASCRRISTYTSGPIRHWEDLIRSAETVFPMMGISPTAWADARDAMGPKTAAVAIAALLERFTELRSPGGYLRALTAKAEAGLFSVTPMIHALSRHRAGA